MDEDSDAEMIKPLISASLILGVGSTTLSFAGPPRLTSAKPTPGMLASNARLRFVKNMGQWDSHVRFLGHAPGVDMWITDTGVTYDYRQEKVTKGQPAKKHDGHVVRISFPGSRSKTQVQGVGKQSYGISYFVGKDRSKWISNAPVYDSATIKNLYKGIDLVAYFDTVKKMPRYDLVVHPGADANRVAMRYNGAEKLRLNEKGDLAYDTMFGRVEERDLLAYQPRLGSDLGAIRTCVAREDDSANSQLRPVAARVKLSEDGTVRFAVAAHDTSKTLVIDPLVYSTFVFGWESTLERGIQKGPDGSAYYLGTIYDAGFPQTTGRYFGAANVYPTLCAKLSKDGSSFAYMAIVGGSNYALGTALAVDASGCAFVAGNTGANDFPTVNAMHSSGFSVSSSYLFKLSADGASLKFSTCIAGDGNDFVNVEAMTLDSAGNPILVGNAGETGLATPGAPFTAPPNGHNGSAFCLKLSSDGSTVKFGTYLGGSSDRSSSGRCVAVDASDNIFLGGRILQATDFPVTSGAFQTSLPARANTYSGFVAKLAADGTSIGYCTLLMGGGLRSDKVASIAVDASGNAYVVSEVMSQDFPVTGNALQTAFSGFSGAALSKLSPDGSSLLYGSYYGGSNGTVYPAYSLIADNQGVVTVAGTTQATNLQVTSDALQAQNLASSGSTGFFGRISTDDGDVRYMTYFGGSTYDEILAYCAAPNGRFYLVGATNSTDFPTTPGAAETTATSGNPSFVALLDVSPPMAVIFNRSTAGGNQYVQGAVTLPDVTTKDLTVWLSGTPEVTIPRLIVIPAGQQAGTFPVLTRTVSTSTQATITASITAGAQKATGTLTVLPARLLSFSLSPATVIGGSQNAQATIVLDGATGPGGNTITLTTPNTDLVTLPATITVPKGRANFTFPIPTKVVPAHGTATITASDASGAAGLTASVDVDPMKLTTFSLGSASIIPGNSSIGRITLNARTSSPVQVMLVPDDPSNLLVPASVTVPANTNAATFNVITNPGFADPQKTITVNATFNGIDLTASTVLSPVLLKSITTSATSLIGGATAQMTITLNQATPSGGLLISLTSSDGAAVPVMNQPVPGGVRSFTFPVSAVANFAGPAKIVTISASLHGKTVSRNLTIKPLLLTGLSLSPTNVKGGAVNPSLVVTLSAPAAIDTAVSLVSDDACASVPATVVVPAGLQTATVTVTTHRVTVKTVAHVSASLNGSTVTKPLAVTK